MASTWVRTAKASYVACAAIIGAFLLSAISLVGWLGQHPLSDAQHEAATEGGALSKSPVEGVAPTEHAAAPPVSYSGDWYSLAEIGKLKITIGWYIDALTVAMFCMITLIASCIHVYATGYMHDELHEVTDHDVTLADGHHLVRPGRFHRFFQYLSLFSFSMLGLVISGNLLMTFVFWELVGICSYFLIGFYFERKSASTAANKAFIVNRVGDFGFIIGLMALFGAIGTFTYGDTKDADGRVIARGIFSQVRSPQNGYQLAPPGGMVKSAAADKVGEILSDHRLMGGDSAAKSEIAAEMND